MKFLNGKKTVLGAIGLLVTYGPDVLETGVKIITGVGGSPADFVKVGTGILTVAGLVHKLVKNIN